MILAVVRIAILTRLLEISVYGQLTLLIIMAGFFTVLCRMAIVTGSLLSAFKGGDEDTGGGEEDAGAEPDKNARQILGTGLVATLTLTVAFAIIVAAFAGPIGNMLIGSTARIPLTAAALLGGLDAAYHLVSTISRFERRPVIFVLLQATHAVLGIVGAVIFIQAGHGLEGAIVGLALGTTAAFIPGLLVNWHRFSLRIKLGYLRVLARKGAPLIMITAGFWLFRHTDIFLVSRYLSDEEVALYRIAARLGALTSALLGAVLMARGPLLRGPLRSALDSQGLLVTADSRLVGYLWLIAIWMLVGLLLLRNLLIEVAPSEYTPAATLIPLLGLAALATTALIIAYRTSRMRRKIQLLITVLLCMTPLLIVLSIVLIPSFGLEGAAVSSIVPTMVGAAVFLGASQRYGSEALDLPWSRLLIGTCVGAAYATVGAYLASSLSTGGTWFSLAATLLFPVVLVASQALPRAEAARILRLIRLARRPGSDWGDSISVLDPDDLAILDALLRQKRSPKHFADERDESEEELLARLTGILRGIGGIGRPHSKDDAIANHLLTSKQATERDRAAKQLAKMEGIDAMEVHRLTELTDYIRGMSWKRWRALAHPGHDADSPQHGPNE